MTPAPRRGAVLLTTMGSLGDLYPVLSIARALEAAGVPARLGLSPDDCEVARRWGLTATSVGPSEAEVTARLGTTRDAIAAEVLRDAGPLLNDVLIPILPDLAADLARLAEGCGCVAGTAFALAGPLAAQGAGLPFVPLTLQPMLAFSAVDPPRGYRMGGLVRRPGRIGTVWNRAWLDAARRVLGARHRRRLDAVRAQLDLPPHLGTPLIDPGPVDVPLRLGLWSSAFSAVPRDAPRGLIAAGFPPAPQGELPDDVCAWIAAGPPPLVVTLGSIAQGLGGGRFWEEAATLARRMDRRAVLLHGAASVPEGPDLLALPYAPHAPLFPLAAAIVHHGGIGTTAEALRSGRPQLVVPVGGDQPDNAARLARLGVAATLPLRRFRADRAHARLTDLIDRFDQPRATALAQKIAAEDGAAIAARHLARIVLA